MDKEELERLNRMTAETIAKRKGISVEEHMAQRKKAATIRKMQPTPPPEGPLEIDLGLTRWEKILGAILWPNSVGNSPLGIIWKGFLRLLVIIGTLLLPLYFIAKAIHIFGE